VKICLNMIVRNEADKIARCLSSLVDHIDCWSITDTGSSDGTPEAITAFFKKHNKPGCLHHEPFVNFEQARNAALTHARTDPIEWDYILLCDADMSLVVKDKDWRKALAGGQSYEAVQRGGTLTYFNKRFVKRGETGLYRGVTHEYLDIPSSGWVDGIIFKDYGDGTNRKDKFVRDIALLLDGLRTEPNNARYWFYLASSYKDAGDNEKAAEAYRQRALMGGWDEEVWYSLYQRAICLKDLGRDAEFIQQTIDAFNRRPTRAETCWLLANYFRHNGMNEAGLMWAERGLQIPYPTDRLFVNDYMYRTGLMEEYSIMGFYNERHRPFAAKCCNKLMLDKEGTDASRNQARFNIYHFLKPLKDRCKSFNAKKLEVDVPEGWVPLNPSVTTYNGALYTTIRTVNYEIDHDGRYNIAGHGPEIDANNPIRTRTLLATLSPATLGVTGYAPLELPPMRPPEYKLVRGFEDCRLFEYGGELCVSACCRETTPEGWCEQVFAKVGKNNVLYDWHRMLPETRQHEKNWMPRVKDGELQFFYRLGTVVDEHAKVIREKETPLATERISGGSQAIPYGNGWLAVVHEANFIPGTQRRYYLHRFVWWDQYSNVRRISDPFVFNGRSIEFCAGITVHPNGKALVVSYGVADREAWIGVISKEDVDGMVFDE